MKASITRQNGKPFIQIDDMAWSPLSFRSFRPEPYNIAAFYKAGVRLMSILVTGLNCTLDVPYSHYGEIWTGTGQYDFSAIDRQMDLFMANAPDAYFNIMLQLDTRPWYLEQHLDCSNTFLNLVEMAGHEPWRRDVLAYLQAVIGYIEKAYGDRVFSYSLFCGGSTEWYTNSQAHGKPDGRIRAHPLKLAAFRSWLGDATAELPDMDTLTHTSAGIFRDPCADQTALNYWHFHHDIIGKTILYFAAEVKKCVQHAKLIGLFYGYIFELTGTRLLYEGHLAYEQVWRSPDIDMIFAPASYGQTRAFDGVSGFLLAVDSVAWQNKLYFHEVDHTTFIAPDTVESGRRIPGSGSRLATLFDSRMVLRREFAMTRTRRTGMWWFDFFGGYYNHPDLMQEVDGMARIDRKLSRIPMHSVSEIAVFADTESMYYVSETARINDDCLRHLRDSLGRIGAPCDLYNFSDLLDPDFDFGPYKLVVFPNAFRLAAEAEQIIRQKVLVNGRSVLWLYAPGYVTDTGCSVENLSRTIGMQVGQFTAGSSLVQAVTGYCNNSDINPDVRLEDQPLTWAFSETVEPLFHVIDPAVTAMARYQDQEAVALARKDTAAGTIYYSAVGNLPAAVLRTIARQAGVFIYYDGDDPIYVNDRLIGIHAVQGGIVTLQVQLAENGIAEELFDGARVPFQNHELTVEIPSGEMKLYLIH
jgi:hypothetical protein